MRSSTIVLAIALLATAGCGGDTADTTADVTDAADGSSTAARGGTITVGGQSWTIVPAIQCSVFSGGVVSIAGHAEGDPSLEVVIDWGGPNGARIAESDSGPGWHAVRDTMTVEIDGRTVRGSATFTEYATGTGKTSEGSFEVNC